MPTIVHFDLPAEDLTRARKFYENLFGWTFTRPPMPMEYYLFTTTGLDGSPGAGGGMGKRMAPDQRMVNYFGVPSVEEYLNKAKSLGASVVMPKSPVPGFGYLALCVDTEGNPFGLWEEDPKAR
jgi:predicted enzyme related to lactoylglutathione lyase